MTTLQLFQNSKDAVSYPAGTLIFDEGDQAELMYAVIEGEVEILHHGKVIDEAGPGALIGEMALIEASPRMATARARTDCRVVPINEKRFLFLVQQTPFFALQVMRILSERLRNKIK